MILKNLTTTSIVEAICNENVAAAHQKWYSATVTAVASIAIVTNSFVLIPIIQYSAKDRKLLEKYWYTINLLIGDFLCSTLVLAWYVKNYITGSSVTNVDFFIDLDWKHYTWPRLASFTFEGSCPLFHHVLASTSRFLSIRRPIAYYGFSGREHKIKLTLLTWLCIVGFTAFVTIFQGIVFPPMTNEYEVIQVILFGTYGIWITYIVIVYIIDIVLMGRTSSPFELEPTRSTSCGHRTRIVRATKRLTYLASIYGITQVPIGICLIFLLIDQKTFLADMSRTNACRLQNAFTVILYLVILNVFRYIFDPLLCYAMDAEIRYGKTEIRSRLNTNNTKEVNRNLIESKARGAIEH